MAAGAPDALDRAIAALQAGQLIAVPTETVYGVVALPTEAGVERLIAAKQRSSEKGIQLLIDSLAQARQVAMLGAAGERLAAAFWPGGLTLVLARKEEAALPELLGGGRRTLGLRLPDHPVPRALARRLGPLAASSANMSGFPPALDAPTVMEALADELALVLDDGPVRGGVASTVVDCSGGDKAITVLREGAIAASDIARLIG